MKITAMMIAAFATAGVFFSPVGKIGAQAGPDSQATPPPLPSADALSVYKVIAVIETADPLPAGRPLRRAEISERELNAYIDFRRRDERWDMMEDLKLKLLDGQKLEGLFVLNLAGTSFASWLPDRATFLFAARLESASGKARIQLDKLYVGQQPIQPAVINLILMFASQKNSDVVSSLDEWVDLPIGIRELRTEKEKLTAFY